MRLTATRLHTIHGFPTPHWTSFVQRAHHALGPCEKPSCLSTGGVGALSSWLDMSLSLCALLGYVGEYYGGPFPWEGTRVKDDGGSSHLSTWSWVLRKSSTGPRSPRWTKRRSLSSSTYMVLPPLSDPWVVSWKVWKPVTSTDPTVAVSSSA